MKKQMVCRLLAMILCVSLSLGLLPMVMAARGAELPWAKDDAAGIAVATRLDSFAQYQADFYLSDDGLDYYMNYRELPYHTYVKNTDDEFEETLATWRIATMDGNDLTSYTTKEVDFYVLLIFDVIYQKMNTDSYLKNFNTQADALGMSTFTELAQNAGEEILELTPDLNIMDDNWESVLNTIVNTETFCDLMDYTDSILSVGEYVGTVEDLINRLSTMKAFIYASDEINLIVTDLYNHATNDLLKEALRQIKLMSTDLLTDKEIAMIFGGDITMDAVSGYALDKLWQVVASSNSVLAGATIGAKIGKLACNFLFGTDAVVENWYSMEKVYTFEKLLKVRLETYMSNFESNPTYDNAVKVNRAVDMYLNTLSVGMDYAIKYAEAAKGGGFLGWLYKHLKAEEYEGLLSKLGVIRSCIIDQIEYSNNEVYNLYLEEMEAADVVEMEWEETPGTVTKEDVTQNVQEFEENTECLVNLFTDEDTTSTEDRMTYANYYLSDGTLDLNGQTLTVYGDFYLSGGKLNVHGGTLDVRGDLYVTDGEIYLNGGTINVAGNATMAKLRADGNYTYLGSNAYLTMDNASDKFTIGGNLITAYYSSSWTKLSAGTMKVGGNWTNYTGSSSSANFTGNDTFTVVLTGLEDVTVYGKSGINVPVLTIENAAKRVVTMEGTVYCGSLTGGNVTIVAKNTPKTYLGIIYGNVVVNGDVQINGDSDLNGKTLTVNGDLNISGGKLNVHSGTLDVRGDLYVTDGEIYLNGGTINVAGNATMARVKDDGNYTYLGSNAYLTMDNASDKFTIGGNLITAYYSSSWTKLSAGTMKVGGNWTNHPGTSSSANFTGNDTFTVVLTGSEDVTVYGKGGIDIPVLTVENAASRVITIEGTVFSGSLTGGKVTIVAKNTPAVHFNTTDGDLVINGDVQLGIATRPAGSVTVNGSATLDDTILYGNKMTVHGDLTVQGDVTIGNAGSEIYGSIAADGNMTHVDGNLKLNYGELTIGGDATMARVKDDGNYTYLGSNAYLTMDNASDKFTIGGNLITAYYSSSWTKLSAGTMKVGGNWTNYTGSSSSANFTGNDTFTVVLTSSEDVTVYGKGVINVPVLTVENAADRKVTMRGTVYTGFLKGGDVTLIAKNTPTVRISNTSGNVEIYGDLSLGLTLKNAYQTTVHGTVNMSSDITLTYGGILQIEGDLIQTNGVLSPSRGTVKIAGDYRIQSGSDENGWTTSYGYLKMVNAKDAVIVGGDFYTQSTQIHSSYLTAGEMAIYGDFWQVSYDGGNDKNFRASGSHKVTLCGEDQQTVIFDACDATETTKSSTSTFNILQLRYEKNGYIFDPDPCWITLLEGQGLPENYKLIYRVTYDTNGGEGQPETQEKIHQIDLTLSDLVPTRTGHTFLGWAEAADATAAEYQPGDTYTENRSATLYAVWEPLTCTVTYDANGGTGAPEAQTGLYDSEITLDSTVPVSSEVFTVTLYRNDGTSEYDTITVSGTFDAWNTAKEGSGTAYAPGDSFLVRGDATLYAQWNDAVFGEYDYTLREGYYLAGWYDSPDVDSKGAPVGTRYLPETKITQDTALYGIWKEIDTTVLYYGDVNLDSIVDIKDLFKINKYRAGGDVLDYDIEEFFLRADADRDGDVDLDDLYIVNDLRLHKLTQADFAAAHSGTAVVLPEQVEFAYGEALNTTGLGLAITFNDSTTYTITEGLTVSGYDPEQSGTQKLTVSFYQFAATYEVTVEGTDTETLLYGDVSRNGEVTLSDLSYLKLYVSEQSGFESYSMEEFLLRCDLDRDRDVDDADLDILKKLLTEEINQASLASACVSREVTGAPKTSYGLGEALNTENLSLTFTFSNGTTYTVTDGLTVSGYDAEYSGEQVLTVSYYQFRVTYTVTVSGPGAGVVDSGKTGDVTWILSEDGVLTIRGNGAMDDYRNRTEKPWHPYVDRITSVVIENGVTQIGSYAFADCVKVRTVDIGNSVMNIEANSFNGCTLLREVTIPDSVTNIGRHAFEACEYMDSATIGNGVSTIGAGAFRDCKHLLTVTIGNSVTTIESYAFENTNLHKVTIPDSVVTIGDYAFQYCIDLYDVAIGKGVSSLSTCAFLDCDGLAHLRVHGDNLWYCNDESGALLNEEQTTLIRVPNSVKGHYTIPETVTTLCEQAFYHCHTVTGVTIPDGITTIKDKTFYYAGLTSVEIPGSVTSIGNAAFGVCFDLANVTLSEGLLTIDYNAFQHCDELTEVNIPSSVTNIGLMAFWKCEKLERITVEEANAHYSNDSYGVLFNKDKTELIQAPGMITGEYKVPSGVESISLRAFSEYDHLTKVTIPDSVSEIDVQAFQYCTSLAEVVFCGDAPSIENSAFGGVVANCYYPADNTTWTEAVMQNYGGTLTWIPYVNDTICQHTFKVVETEAGCTVPGYTESTCTKCGFSIGVETLVALGHQWDEGVVAAEATEQSNGLRIYTCKRCGETREEVIPALDHVHNYTAVVTDPSCVHQGYTTYTCTCGDSYVDQLVDALGHSPVADEAAEPSCTETGLTEGSHCSVCQVVLTAQEEIPALGHQWDEGTVIQEATTDTAGSMLYTCTVCGATKETEIPPTAHEHSYETVVVDPTCTEQGYTVYSCTCGESYVDDVVDALGHMVVTDAAVEASCIASGLTEGSHCERCSEILVSQEIQPAPGHQWDEGVETVVPTDYSVGIRTHTCAVCGEVKEVPIPALAHIHSYEAVVVEPSCISQGYTTYACACGVSYVDDIVNAAGHQWDEGTVTRPATEETMGIMTYTCTVCAQTRQEMVPALDHVHSYGAVVTNPDCTQQGYTTYTCENCGDSYVGDVVDALGHTRVKESGVDPTCTETGLTAGSYCSVCGKTLTVQTVIPATGHNYKSGSCIICGQELVSSGSCGDGLDWYFDTDTGILTISGTGTMEDYDSGAAPWADLGKLVKSVVIEEGVSYIGTNAFAGNNAIGSITFTADAPEIASTALAGVDATAYYPAGNDTWTADKFQNYGGDIRWKPVYETEEVIGISADTVILLPGQRAMLTAELFFGYANAEIHWSLDDDTWAVLTTNGASATITAGEVTEKQVITVSAYAEDGIAEPATIQITILPLTQSFSILDEEGRTVSGTTVWVDTAQTEQITFYTEILPEDAQDTVFWQLPEDVEDWAEYTVNEDGSLTLFPVGKSGTITVTAGAEDGSGKTAEVSVKFCTLEIGEEDTSDEDSADIILLSGKNKTIKVYDAETDKALTNKQITWSMDDVYAPYAKLDAKSGKLTAKKVVEKVRIEVVGTIIGSEGTTVTVLVDIYPVVTMIEVMQDDAVVNGKTIAMDHNASEQVFIVNVYPLDAMEGITWTISDKKNTFAEYEIVDNMLIVSNATGKVGAVTVKVTAADGSGKNTSFKLQFGSYTSSIEIDKSITELTVGDAAVQLTAVATPEKATKTGIVWSLKNAADKAYVSLSSSGKLSPKKVLAPVDVTVVATSKDGMARDEHTIRILPKSEEQLVIMSDEIYVTKTTQTLDVNQMESITLTAYTYGEDAMTDVTWSPLSNKAADITVNEDGSLTVQMLSSGSITITAKAADGRKATVTLKGVKLAQSVEISQKKTNITENGVLEVASGKSLDLQATLEDAATNKVTWSIVEGSQYATVSTSGKVTAIKELTSGGLVVVRATAADGSGVYDDIEIMVRPIAQGVQVYSESGGRMLFSFRSQSWWWVRSNTTLIWDLSTQGETIAISSRVYPYYGEDDAKSAIQAVSWKSSAPKVADIVDGQLEIYRTGSTTITVTAEDGSKQKVSFKLNVVKTVTDLSIDDQIIQSGKTLNLAKLVTINPTDATNKKLTWKITSGSEYATISSSGSFKAKKVTEEKIVEVTVSSQDGGASTTFTVTITP